MPMTRTNRVLLLLAWFALCIAARLASVRVLGPKGQLIASIAMLVGGGVLIGVGVVSAVRRVASRHDDAASLGKR